MAGFLFLAIGMAWFFESQATTTVIFIRHADRASAREQLYLRAAGAIADYDWPAHDAAFKAVLEEYPDDKFALARLASSAILLSRSPALLSLSTTCPT